MNYKKTSAPVGASLVVLSSFFYASYGIWTKLMGNFLGGYTASVLRNVVVLVILIPFALAFRSFEPVMWKKNWRYLVGLVFASFFIWGPLYYAILHAGIGITLTVNYASIVIGMFFFGWLLANERFTKDKWLTAALGLLGLGFVFSPTVSHTGWLALGAAIVSGLGAGASTVIAKKIPYNATQSTIALWLTSLMANVIMAVVLNEKHPPRGLHIQWLFLILFGVASVIASWMLVKGMKLIEAGAAGVLGLL